MEEIEPPVAAIKVAVVEDDERMRQAMAFQLSTAGLEVISYSSAEDFLGAPSANEFDCIVADLFLPKMNGLQLQDKLYRVAPFASIVFVTGHGDLTLGMQAMKKGAVDFLEKPVDDATLLSSINRGAELSRDRRADHVQMAELRARHESLTSREREVFGHITNGLLNKQVAAQLGTTERTIKAHRERVMSKMAADSLATLVWMAGALDVYVSRTRAVKQNS